MLIEKKMLIEYVRDEFRQLVGCVVAIYDDRNGFSLGWSKCMKLDRFDKRRALHIAIGRAQVGSSVTPPYCVRPILSKMENRAKKYFKV